MARIVFYEKPGCAGNARQKALLQAAGHTLEIRDLLRWPWTAESLLDFLGALPVADWFNRAAPRIKSGEIQPEALSREAALPLLLAEPLLIRRPLLEYGEQRRVGFDTEEIDAWIGLLRPGTELPRHLEGCAAGGHGSVAASCPSPHPDAANARTSSETSSETSPETRRETRPGDAD